MLLWLVFSPRLLAQTEDPEFVPLTVQDGLGHSSVYSITQDGTGFMWFGTEDGLNRYDGIRMLTYRHEPANPNSLSSSNFGEVREDKAGILWLGTWGGGLNRFDPSTGRFEHYRHDPADRRSLSQDRIEYLFLDSRSNLWIGTEEAGLNRFEPGDEPGDGTFVRYRHDPADPNSLSSDEVKALAEDRFGDLWVGTDGGLDRFDREGERFLHYLHDPEDPHSLGSNRIRAILEDREGVIWVGTRDAGLDRLDRDTGQVRHFRHDPKDPGSLSDDAVSCLLQDASGTLWVGTYRGGLNRFDPAAETFTSYGYREAVGNLTSDRVEALFEDRANNLWIATIGGGVNRLDLKPRKFKSYGYRPSDSGGLPHPSVRAIAEDAQALWVGTDGGGLARFARDRAGDPEVYRHDPADADSLSSDRIWSLLVDRSGTLWAGTYAAGLNRLQANGRTYRISRYRHDPEDSGSLSDDRVQSLLEDREGHLWLGTASGLNRLLPSPTGGVGRFEVYRNDPADPASLSEDYISVLHEARSGALWVGTRNGLNRFDRATGAVVRFLHDPADAESLSSNIVQALLEDRRRAGVLWVGTEDGGLNRLDETTGRFQTFFVEDGLPSNVVDGILEDDAGHLWLSTSRGLSRFDPESKTFKSYDSTDGLLSHSFIRNAALLSASGEMFFGNIAGLASFQPDQVRDNPHPPRVALISIRKFNEEIVLGKPLATLRELELSYRDRFLSFHFAALDFTAPASNEYAYRLVGFDQDWNYVGGRSFADYTNLDPGRYTFRVKASNNDGVWNEEGLTLGLVVTPPFWQTWWFRGSTLLGFGMLLFGFHHNRTAFIRARARELASVNVALNQEIAERRRTESEKEDLIAELKAKNAEMERFTYTVSHDLKSPLVTIKGFLGFLARDAAAGRTDRLPRDVERIGAAADKMHRLLEELLELARIGRKENPYTEVAMGELVEEALELVAGRVAERGVEVAVEPDLPRVFGDRQRLLEVVQNLIDNAVKFMGEEPDPRIEIGARRDGDEAVFTVRDNGVGLKPRYRDLIFQLFERLDAETEGTGIGLALVKRIVKLHGGRVWVETEGPGHGATFCFTLPRPDGEEAAAT